MSLLETVSTITEEERKILAGLPPEQRAKALEFKDKAISLAREIEKNNENERVYAQLPYSSRWIPIKEKGVKPLSGQRYEYWHSTKRFNIAAAGARSLKTEIGKRRLIRAAVRAIPNEFGIRRFCFAAPVQKQAEAVAWEDLQAFLKKGTYRISKSDSKIILNNTGTEIIVAGLDEPARVEGRPYDGVHLTEYADMPTGLWAAHIRPLVSDRLGWITLEGRPDFDAPNNDNFQELFEQGKNNPEWGVFQWPSSDILPDSELISAKETMSPLLFRQEYEGSFESAPGRAYYEFSRSVHVKDDIAVYNPNIPLSVSCDFNIEHHNWGLYQVNNGLYTAIDEIYENSATVEVMCVSLHEKIQRLNPRDVCFYGDHSGDNRSATATDTAWAQIKKSFPTAQYFYKKQPPIIDRINEVNGKLRDANSVVHFYVHSKCYNLIRDLDKVTRTMLFSQQKSKDLTHMSDNAGYFICQSQSPKVQFSFIPF